MSDATDSQTEDRAGEPPSVPESFALLTSLDVLMQDLRTRIPVALTEWNPDAIHQSRVATRRMKAALDLMKGVLSKRPRRELARVMRKLRRRLGPLRDADVMLEHVQGLINDGKGVQAGAWLAQRLSARRDELRKDSSKRAAPGAVLGKLAAWQPVREQILAAREAVDSLLAESLHLQLDAFAEQADRLCDPGSVRQDPHELRISGKALRYTLEMAVVQGHDLPGELTKSFKKMQDALGLWHDYVVLADRATQWAMDERLSHHEAELMNEVLDVLRELLDRAGRQLDKFKRLWGEEGEAIAKAIRTTFPLTRPAAAATGIAAVTESKTDRDPSGSASPAARGGSAPAAASDA